MSEHKGAAAAVRAIAEALGLTFGQTTAYRARIIADEIVDAGDDELIRLLVADGVAKHLSRMISLERKSIQRVSTERGLGGDRAAHVQTSYLDMPIVMPGETQLPLGDATAAHIEIARDALISQRNGFDDQITVLESVLGALFGLPRNESIRSLIARGVLNLDAVFGERAA